MGEGRKEEPNTSIHVTLIQSRVQWIALENEEAQSRGTQWELGQRTFIISYIKNICYMLKQVRNHLDLALFFKKYLSLVQILT